MDNTNIKRKETTTADVSPLKERRKLQGYDFYHQILGSPKFVVAPMVDQSELAWRMLCRKYKADLCYSPMYHSNLFVSDPKYRKDALQTCAEDRPLIIQFCGNDAQTILDAALLAQDYCDAVDINLGCPQAIAKRGHYGAFLQDEWDLLYEIVKTLHERLKVPVTCKIRILDDREKTIRYAQMLEKAGCQLLTVHGRTREQKGPLTGLADWSYIRDVRANIKIPMFANGNILCLEDIEQCLQETGVDGVMTAEGNLHNPALFTGQTPTTWDIAKEYLELVENFTCPVSFIRGHLFKLFHHLLNIQENANIREELAVANQLEKFQKVVRDIESKYLPYHKGLKIYENEDLADKPDNIEHRYNLSLPPWLCQPYLRLAPELHQRIIEEKSRLANDPNRERPIYYDEEGKQISRKRMKKLRRHLRRPNKQINGKNQRILENCQQCCNPLGYKCLFRLCRLCCREKCYANDFDCPGHRFLIKTRRAKAKELSILKLAEVSEELNED